MLCYKPVSERKEGDFVVDGVAFRLQACTPEEMRALEEAKVDYWQLRCCSKSEEEDGGWSGTKYYYSTYCVMREENALLRDGEVIGFRVTNGDEPEVAEMLFSVEKEGVYYPIQRTRHYSFDGGDGDSVTSYSFALERREPRIVEFIRTHIILAEEYKDNPDIYRKHYREIPYDDVSVSLDGDLCVDMGMDRFWEKEIGKPKQRWNHEYTLLRRDDAQWLPEALRITEQYAAHLEVGIGLGEEAYRHCYALFDVGDVHMRMDGSLALCPDWWITGVTLEQKGQPQRNCSRCYTLIDRSDVPKNGPHYEYGWDK